MGELEYWRRRMQRLTSITEAAQDERIQGRVPRAEPHDEKRERRHQAARADAAAAMEADRHRHHGGRERGEGQRQVPVHAREVPHSAVPRNAELDHRYAAGADELDQDDPLDRAVLQHDRAHGEPVRQDHEPDDRQLQALRHRRPRPTRSCGTVSPRSSCGTSTRASSSTRRTSSSIASPRTSFSRRPRGNILIARATQARRHGGPHRQVQRDHPRVSVPQHDLLDYKNNRFDRDYVEFNVRISDLEGLLQKFINDSFENITSIEHSLQLLRKFQTILQRENLKSDLDSQVQRHLPELRTRARARACAVREAQAQPAVPAEPAAGRGQHHVVAALLSGIEEPHEEVRGQTRTCSPARTPSASSACTTKVARTLVAFEYIWYQAWVQYIRHREKPGLQATTQSSDTRRTASCTSTLTRRSCSFLREAKCLDRMGIEIPEAAKIVLLQEEKFKTYFNELQYALAEYDRIVGKVIPVTAMLLRPHFNDMEFKLRPGMITLTWTSMNIEAYRNHIHAGAAAPRGARDNINDIIENRIEKNMRIVSKTMLVDLPVDQSFSLDEFVAMQGANIRRAGSVAPGQNIEIENAVEDLLKIIMMYPLDSHIEGVSMDEALKLKRHYNHFMYQALLHCTKNSLNTIKKRVASRVASNVFTIERPFFEVDVQLSVPRVQLHPSLDDIQLAINRARADRAQLLEGAARLGPKRVLAAQSAAEAVAGAERAPREPQPLEPQEAARVSVQTPHAQEEAGGGAGAGGAAGGSNAPQGDVLRPVSRRTLRSVRGWRNNVTEYLNSFKQYEWLCARAEGRRIDDEISQLTPVYNIGALSLQHAQHQAAAQSTRTRSGSSKFSDNLHTSGDARWSR
ncbi:hypothetical protein PINS_up020740 [Pythium insidiosum]|nr:hypothetical protein PINS_up020740 [Pythium insidiosum]